MLFNQHTSFGHNTHKHNFIDKASLAIKHLSQLTENEKDSLKHFNCGNEDYCNKPNALPNYLLEYAQNKSSEVIFLCFQDAIIGYMYLVENDLPNSSPCAKPQYIISVKSFAIDKKYQEQGIGKFFLLEIIESYKEKKALESSRILKGLCGSTANPKAEKLYLGLGAHKDPNSINLLLVI